MTLYHYTCGHRHALIEDRLLSLVDQIGDKHGAITTLRPWTSSVVWLTDLAHPNRDALGLTSFYLSCDRTEYRYRVTDETHLVRWVDYRREVPPEICEVLEGAPGARPMHWWISNQPVPVVYDPIHPRLDQEQPA